MLSKKILKIFLVFILLGLMGVSGFRFFQKWKEIEIYPPKHEIEKETEKEPVFEPNLLKWENVVSNAPWSGRDAHTTVVFKDKIWLFGGLEGGTDTTHKPKYEEFPHKNDIWVSEDGINWNEVSEHAAWQKRRSAPAVVFQDKLWLLGGLQNNGKFEETKNDVWYSEDGINWFVAAQAPWSAREGHAAAVFQDKIWIFGGVDFYAKETKNDVWYSEDGINWFVAVSEAPWSTRYDHTVAVFRDKLWLIGGLDFGNLVKKDVWVSEDGKNWQIVSDNPPWSGRHGHVATEFNGFLWIIGGWSEGIGGLNDTWYSLNGEDWKKIEDETSWPGREDHSSVIFQNKIWLFGGMAEEGENWVWKNDIWHSSF